MAFPIRDDVPFDVPGAQTAAERVAVMDELAARGARTRIARRLAAFVRARAGLGASDFELAQTALRVAQRAGYRRDLPAEWFQPVAYTAVHGGDCEDLTPLLAAIATNLGLASQIVWLDQPDRPLNHVALQIRVDGRWLWADPSVCGARLGEDPYDAIARLGAWHVLDASSAPGGACAPF